MTKLPDFTMQGEDSILCPEDCGIINGHITMNGWIEDVARIRGVYAPPLFSDNLDLIVRFNGRRVRAKSYTWAPDAITRQGELPGWKIRTSLLPYGDTRSAILKIEAENCGLKEAQLEVQIEMTGGLGKAPLWGFCKPVNAPIAEKRWEDGCFSFHAEEGELAIAASLPCKPHFPLCTGVIDCETPKCPAQGTMVFYIFLALASRQEAFDLIAKLRKNPETAIKASHSHWNRRVKALFDTMPNFSSSNETLENMYNRSMLHLLLNEWNVPEFALRPYYGTGGINGGCVGCYLWNYGEPYRLWPMLNPKSAREHIRTFLNLNLGACYAFNPDDGSPFGPYYPVNQEKIIFLIHAYVLETGDIEFLRETFNGKMIIEHVLEQACLHDNFSKKAHLVDYGNGNHHLELRRKLRYDGIVPDLNLRRCVNYRLADELCKLAGYKPALDIRKRAQALKALISKELYDKQNGWFAAIDTDGKRYLRYTMQIFKALGWGDWTLTPQQEEALVTHLMSPEEFLGDYGIHSLSRKDPAYDEFDIDNGGPGACVSFAPALCDRLYRDGHAKDAENILRRLAWLATRLPYWGDSQRADIPEYRRDTPLQNDIQGAAIAQTIIFGMFGIEIQPDFSIKITPHLPENTNFIKLENITLAHQTFSITCRKDRGIRIRTQDREYRAKNGEYITLPPAL